jgi:hypothetical protein
MAIEEHDADRANAAGKPGDGAAEAGQDETTVEESDDMTCHG